MQKKKKKKKKKKSIDFSRCELTNAWGNLYTGVTEVPFKNSLFIWVFQATSYGSGLRGMKHLSQWEAESLIQGALREQEHTFCCPPWKSLRYLLLHTLLSELLSQLGSAVGPSTKAKPWAAHAGVDQTTSLVSLQIFMVPKTGWKQEPHISPCPSVKEGKV